MLLIHAANLPKSTKVISGPKCLRALMLIAGLFLAGAAVGWRRPLGFAQSPAQSPPAEPKKTSLPPTPNAPSGPEPRSRSRGPAGRYWPHRCFPRKKRKNPKRKRPPKGRRKVEGLKENFSMRRDHANWLRLTSGVPDQGRNVCPPD